MAQGKSINHDVAVAAVYDPGVISHLADSQQHRAAFLADTKEYLFKVQHHTEGNPIKVF